MCLTGHGRVGMRRVFTWAGRVRGERRRAGFAGRVKGRNMPSPSPAVFGPRVGQPSPSPAACPTLVSPMQEAIVLSHEDAALPCTVPYLAARLRPLPVMEVLGRSATREPKCPPREAVYYFWKECSCPGCPIQCLVSVYAFFHTCVKNPGDPAPLRFGRPARPGHSLHRVGV